MIDKKPNDWSEDLVDAMGWCDPVVPILHEEAPSRRSGVLGPDGEPVMLGLPRRRIGFDLTKRSQREK